MFDDDQIMIKGIVAFLIPTALGVISYFAATLAARLISPVPRYVYLGRMVFMAVFVLLIWTFYFPSTVEAFSGTRERYYARGMGIRSMGTIYGMHTIWIWCIIALVKCPKRIRDDSAASCEDPSGKS
jgi:hypothetical protein